MTIQSLQLRFPHLPSGGRVITSPLYLSKLLGESNEATPMEALRTLQRGVIHSSDNTHNNFNSTDRSGINSPQRVVLLRALQWSVFRIESSQWIGKCVDADFAKAAKAGITSLPGSLQPQEVKSRYLAKVVIISTPVNLFPSSVFANLFSWRALELFPREEGHWSVSSIKWLWSLFVKFFKNRESSFKG